MPNKGTERFRPLLTLIRRRKIMKASINVDDLKRMLKNADKITDGRGSSESVSGKIVLSVHDGKFEVFALSTIDRITELSQWVEVADVYDDDFECICAVEDGAWTVSAKALAPLKAAKKGSTVVISGDGGKVSFCSPGIAFSVNAERGIFGGAYLPAKFGDALASVELLPADCDGFKFCAPALSDDITRPDFTGALIRRGALVATDGCRLHYYPLAGLIQESEFKGIVNPKVVNFIAGGAYGQLSERQCGADLWHVLESNGMRLDGCAIRGQFPDFSRVIPRYKADKVTEFMPRVLAEAVKPLCAGWKTSTLYIQRSSKGGAYLQCVPFGKNKGEPPRSCQYPYEESWPEEPIGLNPLLLLDALRGRDGALKFCHIDKDSPLWVGLWEDGVYGWGAIIMPMS